jgi:hypothetical protein
MTNVLLNGVGASALVQPILHLNTDRMQWRGHQRNRAYEATHRAIIPDWTALSSRSTSRIIGASRVGKRPNFGVGRCREIQHLSREHV